MMFSAPSPAPTDEAMGTEGGFCPDAACPPPLLLLLELLQATTTAATAVAASAVPTRPSVTLICLLLGG
jgi:hypothetical protein